MPLPASADLFEKLAIALVAICNADATLRSLCGRTTEILVEWESLGDAPLPVLAFFCLPFELQGNDNEHWAGTVQITAVAAGNDGAQLVNDLLARVVQIVQAPALDAQGVDAAPMIYRRIAVSSGEPAREGTRGLKRADLEIEFFALRT